MTTNLKLCEHCGKLVPVCELSIVNNHGTIETWCEDCIDSDACYCERCHQYRPGEITGVYHDGHIEEWCETCVDSRAVSCDHCNDLTDENDCQTVYIHGVGYQTICTSCLDENYYQCDTCGDYCLEDDVDYRDGNYYCPTCLPSRYLDEYHHTEGEHFLSTGDEVYQPYLGVELEMEFETDTNRASAAEHIRTNMTYGDYYECKTDSSLGDYGMECVTQPATPAYHLSGYDQLMLSAGITYDATSHDNGNCGLHVHIDRDYFTNTGIANAALKAAFIMDTIISNNEVYIVNFTRRRYSQLNRWAAFMNMHACKAERDLIEKLREYSSSKYNRYQAVNTENDTTIELRLFRGTLNGETYAATIQFVAALAYLTCALLPIPEWADTLTWSDLKAELFAALDCMELSSVELAAYLKRRGI